MVTPTLPETISFTPPKPVIGLPELPELPAPPTFNIQLGSYCNYMADCGSSVNGGAYNYDFDLNAFSVLANAPGTKGRLRDGYPSLRHSWNNTGSVLLKSYFDTETNYNLTTNLTVNSENPLNNAQQQSERDANRGYNAQRFLVGGSRAATMDNAPANTDVKLDNKATVNLVGPLTVGFEVQTDTYYGPNGSKREMVNTGTITDAAETTLATIWWTK